MICFMRFFLSSFILLILASMTFSQSKAAVPIDEFGSVQCEEYLARMDNIFIQAANNPNAKIYVFVYDGKTQSYIYN